MECEDVKYMKFRFWGEFHEYWNDHGVEEGEVEVKVGLKRVSAPRYRFPNCKVFFQEISPSTYESRFFPTAPPDIGSLAYLCGRESALPG